MMIDDIEYRMNLPFRARLDLYHEQAPWYLLISERAKNVLFNSDIWTDEELTAKSSAELMREPNFGRKSLNEVLGYLSAKGLILNDFKAKSEEKKMLLALCLEQIAQTTHDIRVLECRKLVLLNKWRNLK